MRNIVPQGNHFYSLAFIEKNCNLLLSIFFLICKSVNNYLSLYIKCLMIIFVLILYIYLRYYALGEKNIMENRKISFPPYTSHTHFPLMIFLFMLEVKVNGRRRENEMKQ